MDISNLICGFGGATVSVIVGIIVHYVYLGKGKGTELLRRRALVFRIIGLFILGIAILLFVATKFNSELRDAATLWVPIGFSLVVLGITCLGFAEVFRTMCKLLQERAE